jgi:hypothetical protein
MRVLSFDIRVPSCATENPLISGFPVWSRSVSETFKPGHSGGTDFTVGRFEIVPAAPACQPRPGGLSVPQRWGRLF